MQQKYALYKPSSVEWIGEVPEHWEVKKIKFVCFLQSGETITAERIAPEGTYPVYGGNGLRGYTDRYTHDGFYPLIGRQGALCGNINYGNGAFYASEHAIVVTPWKGVNPLWLGELLRCMNLNQYSVSAAQPGLAVEALKQLAVPVPSVSEQNTIAAYLDEKTALIDDTIRKKQRLIELLQEERTALINQAVTHGLDPSVPMKPSGVDWLGEIPAHWDHQRLKRVVQGIEQGWSPQCEARLADEGEWGVLKVGCVNWGRFDPMEHKALPKELKPDAYLEVQPGDLLMSRANTKELVGSTALVYETRPQLMLCDKLYRIKYRPEVHPKYLELQLNAKHVRVQMEQDTTGASSSMQNISQELVRELMILLPPYKEQQHIVEVVDQKAAAVTTTIGRIGQEISLLQEYRTALINEVVTGKRCVVPQPAALATA